MSGDRSWVDSFIACGLSGLPQPSLKKWVREKPWGRGWTVHTFFPGVFQVPLLEWLPVSLVVGWPVRRV